MFFNFKFGFIKGRINHPVNIVFGFKSESVKGHIVQFVVFVNYQHDFIIPSRPCTVQKVVLFFKNRTYEFSVVSRKHFLPQNNRRAGGQTRHGLHTAHNAGFFTKSHHSAHIHAEIFKQNILQKSFCVRPDDGSVGIFGIYQHIHIVGILNTVHSVSQAGGAVLVGTLCFDIFLKGFQVIFLSFHAVQGIYHLIHHGFLINRIVFMLAGGLGFSHKGFHKGAHIHVVGFQRQGIGRKGFLLNRIYVSCHALGNGENQSNSDNSDASGKRCQRRPSLLGKQVFKRKAEGCPQRHGGLLLLFA